MPPLGRSALILPTAGGGRISCRTMRPLSLLCVAIAFIATSVAAGAETVPTLRDVTSARAAGMAGSTIGFAADPTAALTDELIDNSRSFNGTWSEFV